MADLFLPEATPPLVTPEAKDEVSTEILTLGIVGLWEEAVVDFYERQPILFHHILEGCNFLDAEGNSINDDRPDRVFRTGAVIAERAYVKSGFDLSVDNPDKFDIAFWEAEWTGIPDAYLVKGIADTALQDLLAVMLDVPQMQDGAEEYGGYEQILGIGAGFTRHYLQHELAA